MDFNDVNIQRCARPELFFKWIVAKGKSVLKVVEPIPDALLVDLSTMTELTLILTFTFALGLILVNLASCLIISSNP